MRESCSLKLGVFHMPTLTPAGCGLLLYNSYSLGIERSLYRKWISMGVCWVTPGFGNHGVHGVDAKRKKSFP